MATPMGVIAAAAAGIDILLIEFGAMVLGLAILARVARRLTLPILPVYLLAGLAFGEGGLLELGSASEFIRVGAEIGVILMLLMLGLEFSAHELIDNLRKATGAGIADFLLNFPPGLVAGLLLGFDPIVAVLFGGVTYISSSGIVAKLVTDLGRINNPESRVVLSVLVIEDLAMVLYLPIVTSILVGGSPLRTGITLGVSMVVVVAVLAFAYHFGDRVSELVLSKSREALLLTLIGTTLLIAGLAERVHISTAVGAFLVGVALSGELVEQAKELLDPLRDLFAASFFLFFGLQVDPGLIPGVALLALALGAVTVVTKLGTGWMATRTGGHDTPTRIRTGAALIARGEFSIVIAELGVSREPDLGALSAAYVILMAVVGGLIYHYSDSIIDFFHRRFPSLSQPPS